MASYLITGGCGFIGSHLADALVQNGDRVRILDDLSSGRRENAPAEAELVIGDVRNRSMVEQTLEGVNGCFHLAAIASVLRSHEDALGTHSVNASGSVNVLEMAGRFQIPVVYASSAAVYGFGSFAALPETAPTAPLSAYGIDKLATEMHARVASHTRRIPTTGLRFFNVYGPRQDPHSAYSGVISIFCRRLSDGLPLTIYGSGEQVRDFIYVGDVVRHLVAAMQNTVPRPLVFNVCTGVATSIRSVAEILGCILGLQPEIACQAERPGDIRVSLGDPAAAQAYFGMSAETPLRHGLELTAEDLLAPPCRSVNAMRQSPQQRWRR